MSAPETKDKYTGKDYPQVWISTDRLLSASSTELILNMLAEDEFILSHVRRFDIKGESIPATINSGPNRGLVNNHSERRIIRFGTQEVELTKAVGDFYLELLVKDEAELNEVFEEIKKVCNEAILPLGFGYTLSVGRYTKYRSTLSDSY
jgi:methyl-coenzyme M reductase subunit D